jgi:hypothetical protein
MTCVEQRIFGDSITATDEVSQNSLSPPIKKSTPPPALPTIVHSKLQRDERKSYSVQNCDHVWINLRRSKGTIPLEQVVGCALRRWLGFRQSGFALNVPHHS